MQPSWYTSIFCSHACTVVLILSMHCCPCPQHAARMEHQQILQDLTAHAAACPHGSGKACTAQHTMCVDDQASLGSGKPGHSRHTPVLHTPPNKNMCRARPITTL
ncbi:hypothetical protein COO60DRAFT_1496654 [Scenedesmus sp. NREL 46B-D3]|nr:hypothetical protein COO60DRAFT_1496654 [Scenedesmus sp. NREL 46B-D3]